MKNIILKKKIFYRLYQNLIRKRKNEYNFLEFVFKKQKNINILDICCGDSYVLKYIEKYVCNYIGIDNNKDYLKESIKKYPKFSFYYLDIKKISTLKVKNINFVFLNGAIHHFDDDTIKKLIRYIKKKFPKAIFLSIDPLRDKNNFINEVMIKNDRGKFIRKKDGYKKILNSFSNLITDEFFIMKFLLIFHYRNIDLKKYYDEWKKL